MGGTVAILPVKRFGLAKQRLTGGFPDRPGLAAAMVADVLDALALVEELDGVIVVTAAPVSELHAPAGWQGRQPVAAGTTTAAAWDERPPAVAAESIEARPGVVVVHDPVEAGQSAAAQRGIDAALERGARRALLVPGDCPALDPAEVRALLAHDEGVVIVPDRHGTGTNALLLTPPDVMAPAFGEGSFARHAALAKGAGAGVRIADVRSLGLDVDTPDDLAALRRALAARPGGAARTRALLAEAAFA